MMHTDSVVLSLYFETPLHATADGGLGAIDLPIQRERTTLWPIVQAAEMRSALRRALEPAVGQEAAVELFGGSAPTAAGQGVLSVGDARLLLFPIRSSVAPLVWVTCPSVLARLRRDLERTIGGTVPQVGTVTSDEILTTTGWSHGSDPLALEDLVLTPKTGADFGGISALLPSTPGAYDGFAKDVESAFGVISDEVFGFLVRTAMEVTVVQGGNGMDGLVEEMVPSDSLFYVPILGITESPKGVKKPASMIQMLEKGLAKHLQVGGDSSLGRGWAKVSLLKAKVGTP